MQLAVAVNSNVAVAVTAVVPAVLARVDPLGAPRRACVYSRPDYCGDVCKWPSASCIVLGLRSGYG